MGESRIQLNDTVMSAVVKMSDGNPGALTVMVGLIKDGGKIDPNSFMGGFGNVMDLDTLRIYGPRIWMLYKDVCGQDLRVMCAVLRAWQLGFVTDSAINAALDNEPWRKSETSLDLDALVVKVEERLPEFQRVQPATS